MKISKKCRYGIRALIDLAANSENEYMVLGNIAERNGISSQYLEQVFASLRRAGIVKGSKGAQGGYRLNVVPGELTVSEILEALDGSYRIEEEEIPEDIHGRGIALSIQELIIDRLNTQMEQVLKNVTLEDLQKNYQDSKLYNQDMYYI
ncbi:Rrf2 family transcriptional regulator [Dorea acetigenes]|uniref:Rrf2 family transcriptional regulator n=1 Tax=Dorea acetigenes TaxID=2981787 RepID=A0ABT2RP60_9FIRM|nr:Rrf2 family transcriptional regulator [Dorea acetigenes]MCB6415099.1 Rrf2 family transcriptional regulator [Faecalimonas umbilicata]MCU6687198.1 Rrf2 family transcriptional regulator [Dorea acetigenes]SCJ31133.1 Cysteine metabolism repressor [uncultured Clostridium sp.]